MESVEGTWKNYVYKQGNMCYTIIKEHQAVSPDAIEMNTIAGDCLNQRAMQGLGVQRWLHALCCLFWHIERSTE